MFLNLFQEYNCALKGRRSFSIEGMFLLFTFLMSLHCWLKNLSSLQIFSCYICKENARTNLCIATLSYGLLGWILSLRNIPKNVPFYHIYRVYEQIKSYLLLGMEKNVKLCGFLLVENMNFINFSVLRAQLMLLRDVIPILMRTNTLLNI